MGILARIWNGLRALLGLVLPVFSRPRDFSWLSRPLRWFLHFLFLVGMLILLYWLGQRMMLPKVLERAPLFLRPYWLPIFFLVLYAIAWLGWWLWSLLTPEELTSDFPDLDAAWNEAMYELGRARLWLNEAPLYLVLGRSRAGDDALFAASKLNPRVPGAPYRPDAPIRIFGHADAIFITCPDASLLGRQSQLLHAAVDSASPAGPARPAYTPAPNVGDKTITEFGFSEEVMAILKKARDENRDPTPEERRQINILMGASGGEAAPPTPSWQMEVLTHQQQMEMTARLRHLCRLIARERRPLCPINGVVLLIPWEAARSKETADLFAAFCRADLLAAHDALQLDFAALALICDMERAAGFNEFLKLAPPGKIREQRMGQRLPLLHDLSGEDLARKLEDLGRFLCRDSMLVKMLMRMFRVETPGGKETAAEVFAGNERLFHLLAQLHERHAWLGRILSRGIGEASPAGIYFGGCYVAATGPTEAEQLFVPGFFRRLLDAEERFEDNVSWTPAALEEDALYQRWTRAGYAAIAAGLAVLAVLVAWWWYRRT